MAMESGHGRLQGGRHPRSYTLMLRMSRSQSTTIPVDCGYIKGDPSWSGSVTPYQGRDQHESQRYSVDQTFHPGSRPPRGGIFKCFGPPGLKKSYVASRLVSGGGKCRLFLRLDARPLRPSRARCPDFSRRTECEC